MHWQIVIDMRHWKDVGQWEKEYILYKPIEMRYWLKRRLMQDMHIVWANWDALLRKHTPMQT